jgi:uncharacterized protein YjbI with pentapeptide repeats
MAHPDHLVIFRAGRAAVEQWKNENPGAVLDLSDIDLSNSNFEGWNLSNINAAATNFTAANFNRANLSGSTLDRAILNDAQFVEANLTSTRLVQAHLERINLTKAHCEGANFHEAILTGACVIGAEFAGATFTRASIREVDLRLAQLKNASLEQLSLQEIDLTGYELAETRFHNSDLTRARLSRTILIGGGFISTNLSEAILDSAVLDRAQLKSAKLRSASLVGASLRNANLELADLSQSKLDDADFYEATVDLANFDKAAGVTHAMNLHTVRLSPDVQHDVRYFDSVIVPGPELLLSWERIRFLGRLPLFGASYFALIAIPFLYYLLDIFNRKIDLARSWAMQEVNTAGSSSIFARFIIDHLHREPIPNLSLLMLISTICLGLGATLFLACPTRVREFSRDQWRDQLGRSLIHYLPLTWRYRTLRILCVLFYLVGGLGVLAVIVSKLWNVFWFIIENR